MAQRAQRMARPVGAHARLRCVSCWHRRPIREGLSSGPNWQPSTVKVPKYSDAPSLTPNRSTAHDNPIRRTVRDESS